MRGQQEIDIAIFDQEFKENAFKAITRGKKGLNNVDLKFHGPVSAVIIKPNCAY